MNSTEEAKILIEQSKKYIFPQRYNAFARSILSMAEVYQNFGLDVIKDVVETLKLLKEGDVEAAKTFWAFKTNSYQGENHYLAPIKILATKVICNTSIEGEKFFKAIYLDGKKEKDPVNLENYKKLSSLNEKFKAGTETKEDCESRYF